MLGLSLSTITIGHTLISLIAIAAGLYTLAGMVTDRYLAGWTAFFLVTTILTSATGFLFPFTKLLPSHIVGIISLIVLLIAVVALYGAKLHGFWRLVYVISATLALYLNVFVLVVQAFQKVDVLRLAAPTQSEPPFLIAQVVTLAVFVLLGFMASRRFHPMASPALR